MVNFTDMFTGATRWERAQVLDPAVAKVRGWVRAVPLGQRTRDVLHGVPLGHALHPALVQLPIGAWMSAAALDLSRRPEHSDAARRLVGLGVLAAAPAAVAGWVDWAEQHQPQLRVGLVHASTNGLAISLYAASYLARRAGRGPLGRVLAMAGLTAVSLGGMIGGHLVSRQASGVNHAEEVPYVVPGGWQDLGPLADLAEDRPERRMLGETALLVVRHGEQASVLAGRCSHLSGPLPDGELDVADGCVTCPWHGSTFRLADGAVVSGPAIAPQPVFQTRVVDGRLEVRLPE
ncbi:Rieske (2Fe-2S) protein [Allostreptomyces psammosilenae]|uniref:Nitrite reductase/ring-hydroxylating ferredoxin subunit/uncharacterized membrane protein n=1 Tax=Allostreptomyces psammosilenae TaxID=1892865 RepID=A0A852ZQZ7_9ACTN|nr:Rieske (2Fe-2S) protein [Allostreptomyces psammosilenae]NYI04175.1 nitrite reductase/ring-hydroxylating ferredoxin subunit/uncharacterized membrane protein [Allostreptomyces psammosilenae]